MAHGGRPVERPAHLSQGQRLQAQERTRWWRQQLGLSQPQMAAEVHVSSATYRGWENGKDHYAGPTRAHTEALNGALRRLLPAHYSNGEAFDVWGWPREQDMSYEQVAELLRFAGFSVPRPQATLRPPAQVFWPHKVRKAHLVHGVYALAAAAATRAGLPVHLLLDDLELNERDRHQCQELESWVRTWVAFASGDDAKVTVGLFSSVLTDEYLAERAWPAVNDYLNRHSSVLRFLLASKVVSPLRYSADADRSVLELERDRESIRADRLLTTLRNFLVFEAEITRLLDLHPAGSADIIVTLGGDDERDLWEMWHRGCSESLSARVQHLFLRAMPISEHIEQWQVPALIASDTDRSKLTIYLNNHAKSAGFDLIEWLLRSAVHLPAVLSPGFREALDPTLGDVEGLLRSSSSESSTASLAGPIARAIVTWLTG
jgi:transcriptional regulator with XRE-family HTH domain